MSRNKKYPFYKQLDQMDCGPTCLKMIAKYYGKSIDLNFLRQNYSINRTGVTLGGLAEAAESIGLKSYGARINIDTLKNEVPLPCIVNWRQRHYIVIYQINKGIYTVADPAYGIIKYIESEFLSGWIPSKNIKSEDEGIVLLLEPSVNFLTPTLDFDTCMREIV